MEFIATVTQPTINETAYFEVFSFAADRASEIAFINAERPGFFAREATVEEVSFVEGACFGPTYICDVEEEDVAAYEIVRGSGIIPKGWSYAQVYPNGTWRIRRPAW